MTRIAPRLETARLILRLGEPGDTSEIVRFYQGNKEYLTPWSPDWPPGFFTERYWQEQLRLNLADFRSGSTIKLFIFPKNQPEKVIGVANFSNVVRGAFQACYLGYNLAETEQGKGFMVEALQAAIAYVFTDFGLHRIMANYMPHNRRSGNVLRRLGFVVDGYARDYLLIGGEWQDHVLTSLSNPNWKAL
jgi:ribosomal-protein-alanine N-acetyltransferase